MSSTTPLPPTYLRHASALLLLAAPLALSQLSEMAMGVTDTVLLGGLGVTAVAIGGLSSAFFYTTMIIFQAILGGQAFYSRTAAAQRTTDKQEPPTGAAS
ncbi:hypothetical protein [Neokomagataea tanensis]|uniref:hypothetical protein n=1 Tax=Neokomagataea tanensis TaxID=661191 RepID=UPI001F10487E|nr:hypothetical protein [Neokomagataea tanensis]